MIVQDGKSVSAETILPLKKATLEKEFAKVTSLKVKVVEKTADFVSVKKSFSSLVSIKVDSKTLMKFKTSLAKAFTKDFKGIESAVKR